MNSPSLFESKAVIQLTLMEPVDLSPFYYPKSTGCYGEEVYEFTDEDLFNLLGPYLGKAELIRNHAVSMVVPQPDGTTIHLGKVTSSGSIFVFIELEAT